MFDPDAFSTDFELQTEPDDEPADEPAPESDGPPWISHGTVHLGRKPNH